MNRLDPRGNPNVIPTTSCRVCLWTTGPTFSLFSATSERNHIKEKYTELFSYPVERDDGRPIYICTQCAYKLEIFHEFKQIADTSYNAVGNFRNASEDVEMPLPGNLLVSPEVEKEENDPSDNVPLSNDTVQNDVPGCSPYEIIECDEEQNGGNIESNSIIIDNNAIEGNDDNNNTASSPHQNTSNKNDGRQEIGNWDAVGSTSASLENQRAAIGSESNANGSAGLPSNTSNNNERSIIKSVGKKIPQFSCNKCPEKFFSKLQLELHYCNSLSSSAISCRYCQKQFSDRTELSAHKKVHLSLFSEHCRKCGEVFQSPKALRVHKNSECIARGESRPSTPLTPLHECRICGRYFASLAGKKQHDISKEHRANVTRHSLKMKASKNSRVVCKKTDQEISNGTKIIPNSHPVINGSAETKLARFNSQQSEQGDNDSQMKYPRIRRRTYSDSVWLIG